MDKLSSLQNIGTIREAQKPKDISANSASDSDKGEFANLLKKSVDDLNEVQKTSEKALADMASGQVKDLHQAAIAIGRAETSMKLMLEVRNKAINAYKEILRTQI
ncbi:MAG: flagellar hook-basal body complex protein FliE [Helicobacter sp.]|mgnify:CR=1 FL=1|nr:flagellar hook-basal body complex protein FliE [Helicobacter sp.]